MEAYAIWEFRGINIPEDIPKGTRDMGMGRGRNRGICADMQSESYDIMVIVCPGMWEDDTQWKISADRSFSQGGGAKDM